MKLHHGFTLLGLAAVAFLAAGCPETNEETSGSTTTTETAPDPEALCVDWADASCKTLATCCGQTEKFDEFACTFQLSGACLEGLPVDLIHAGAVVFDEAAARECLAPMASCALDDGTSAAHEEACRNALTGYRPPGAGCDTVFDCLRPEQGYAVCYEGVPPGAYGGVCADVTVSTDGKCRFVKDTSRLTVCPANSFCDVKPPAPKADSIPTDYLYAFEADCVPHVAEGQACIRSAGGELTVLPCAEGLYCHIDADVLEHSACAALRKIGESCDGYAPGECVDGAECSYDTGTCQASEGVAGYFCHAPDVCGDDTCGPSESLESCPEDCGYCGDGTCTAGEKEWCLEDCGSCGDGICYGQEDTESCPQDCTSSCQSCAEYVTNGVDPATLCTDNGPPSSLDIYNTLAQCVCAGTCQSVCSDNVCAGKTIESPCQACVANAVSGCGSEYNACANDI